MKPLFTILLSAMTLFAMSANAATRLEIKQMVMEQAADSRVPVSLALAVAKVESDFNAKALSSAGARGVMQIMPDTARKEFGIAPRQLWDAKTNIRLGVQFLEQLYQQYDRNWELALSHYNGGTIKGNRPHNYTKKYVQKVQKWQAVYAEQASLWAYLEQSDNQQLSRSVRRWQVRSEDRDTFEEVALLEEENTFDDDWERDTVIFVERRPSHRFRPPPPPFQRFGPRNHRPRHFR